MKLNIKSDTVTQHSHLITLDTQTLLSLLKVDNAQIPLNARVSLDVPTGGDYSGESLEIGDFDDECIKITWTETWSKYA